MENGWNLSVKRLGVTRISHPIRVRNERVSDVSSSTGACLLKLSSCWARRDCHWVSRDLIHALLCATSVGLHGTLPPSWTMNDETVMWENLVGCEFVNKDSMNEENGCHLRGLMRFSELWLVSVYLVVRERSKSTNHGKTCSFYRL